MSLNDLKISTENVADLSEEEYALSRKHTFGASDVSALFGIGFGKLEEIIANKACPYVTEQEKAIGKLPSVRKGKDLEPLILAKFVEATHLVTEKPRHTYEVCTGLTVNFDGVIDNEIPVELKYITTFGVKYWNFGTPGIVKVTNPLPYNFTSGSVIADYITEAAKHYGVPPYYYIQSQVQILGLKAPYGYIAGLSEKDWEIYIYKIWADPVLMTGIPIAVMKYLASIAPTTEENENFEY